MDVQKMNSKGSEKQKVACIIIANVPFSPFHSPSKLTA